MFKRIATVTLVAAALLLTCVPETVLALPATGSTQQGGKNVGANAYQPPGAGDMRSPCPALNALANHGYLSRDGKNWPATSVKQSLVSVFNLSPNLAAALSYAAAVNTGSPTRMTFSLGDITGRSAASSGAGLSHHGVVEHDASMTRGDAHFGDQVSYNATLADGARQLALKMNGGVYNADVISRHRYERYMDSKTRNPSFFFMPKQVLLAYGEAALVLGVFGGVTNKTVSQDVWDAFLRDGRIPDGWKPTSKPVGVSDLAAIAHELYTKNPVPMGAFSNGDGNFTLAGTSFPDSVQGLGCFVKDVIGANIPSVLIAWLGFDLSEC